MRVLRTGSMLGQSTSERRRAIGFIPRSMPGPGGDIHAPAPSGPSASDDDHQDRQAPLKGPLHDRPGRPAEPALDDGIPENHLPGDPSENRRTHVDDPPEPRHKAREKATAPDHER